MKQAKDGSWEERKYHTLDITKYEVQGERVGERFKTLSIEHVLPQTPKKDSQWVKWFPHDIERSKFVHRIGNLVLLSRSKNSQAKNYEFEKKKNEYFVRKGVSSFAITPQVLQEDEWTSTIIEKRQEKLVNVLKKIWRL
ncbi:HNH endonuclease [Aneurinibacillus sp. BA2021]|nr:HNH endonuclease [Aneurinibacillus sp. BA2021]